MKVYFLRIGASIIDFFLLLPIFLLLAYLYLLIAQMTSPESALLFFVSCLLVAFAIYSPLLMIRKIHNGQTIGKQLLGISVKRKGDASWNYAGALWRQFFIIALLFLLLGWPFFFLPLIVDLLWPFLDKNRQMLHDKLTGTSVEKIS